jgi:heptosyltransferase I
MVGSFPNDRKQQHFSQVKQMAPHTLWAGLPTSPLAQPASPTGTVRRPSQNVVLHQSAKVLPNIEFIGLISRKHTMTKPSRPSKEHERILIVRLSALGDIIQTMPVACALRDRFPHAKIDWVCQQGGSSLLDGHPALDEVLAVPRRWMRSLDEIRKVRRLLRSKRYDLAIDAQGLLKSASLARLSGAKRRIGFARPWGREMSPWLATEAVDTQNFVHIIDRNLRILRPFGVDNPDVRFDIAEFPEARAAFKEQIHDIGLSLEESRLAILNVGAAWPSKRWPPERFALLARHLAEQHNLISLTVFGSEEEQGLAEQVVQDSEGVARLAPKMSLQGLVELCRASRIFVGGDTGPLHMAAAVETPSVGLYGPFPAERHGPRGEHCVMIQKMTMDGPVRERRRASDECMRAIDFECVAEACDCLLGRL